MFRGSLLMFQTVVLSYLLIHGMHIPCQVNIISTHLCHHFIGRKDGLLRGIPNERVLLDNRTKRISLSLLPSAEGIAQQYRNSGGHVTDAIMFGLDPIANNVHKCFIRMSTFTEYYPSFDMIFHQVANGNDVIFQEALIFFIDVTHRLSAS